MVTRWIVALALCVAPTVALAQPREAAPLRARNVVAWQPLSLVTGYVDLEYERAFGRSVSVYAAPGAIFYRGRPLNGPESTGVYGWSLDVGGRWFPRHDAPAGVFTDASLGVFTSSLDETGADRVRGLGFRGMLLGGYTLLAWNHLAISLGLGVQLRAFRSEDAAEYAVKVYPALRVAVGFAL